MRCFSAPEFERDLNDYLPIAGLNPAVWLRDTNNIALTDGEGSYALFEWAREGTHYGHYFFKVRGKAACSLSKRFLAEFFGIPRTNIIIGLTPVENKPALWMNRYLGFKYLDTIDTREGPTQMFILTKEEWRQANG